MIIQKKAGTRWKYSRQVSWALHHTPLPEIDGKITKIVWSLEVYEKSLDVIRLFFADCFNGEKLVMRIKGKALYTGDEIKIIISDKIIY